MNIAFFGPSLVSTFWNGFATYFRGIIRALHYRGHHITFYEPESVGRQQHRDFPDPDWARVVVYPADESAALKMIEQASAADAMVKANGVGMLDEFLENAIAETKRPDGLTILWDADAPARLERIEQNPDDPFRALATL